MTHHHDLLSHAGDFLRAASEPGWDAIAAWVISAVRATPRPGGRPLVASTPGERRGHILVSENVVRATLAVGLRQRYLCAPTSIEFDIDNGALRAVHIEVTGSYGTDLRDLADRIRATIAEAVVELLGPPTPSSRGPIEITVTNIVVGDPLRI